jgi:hypothetical protein
MPLIAPPNRASAILDNVAFLRGRPRFAPLAVTPGLELRIINVTTSLLPLLSTLLVVVDVEEEDDETNEEFVAAAAIAAAEAARC